MIREPVSANRLLVVLCIWFAGLFGGVIAIGAAYPEFLPYLPLGGNDVMEIVGIDADDQPFFDRLGSSQDVDSEPATSQQIGMLALFLSLSLGGTVVVMLPVTWTYAAIKREIGFLNRDSALYTMRSLFMGGIRFFKHQKYYHT